MFQLTNDQVSLEVIPELGGKISSLIDKRTGRDWLWTNPHLERRPPVYGESYVEQLDTGGWDEIFPSINSCELPQGIRVPDHGDLVFLPTMVIDQSSQSLTLATLTRSMRTRFSRKLELDGDLLTIHYILESLDDRKLPFLWAPHPLIALEDGMMLELPTDRLTTRDGLDLEATSGGGCRIHIRDPEKGEVGPHQLKCFTGRLSTSWASLTAADGASLRLDWDVEDAPYLGIWLNQRSWSGCGSEPYFNLGLEPTTAPCDGLPEAIEMNEHLSLEPGGTRTWSVRLKLEGS